MMSRTAFCGVPVFENAFVISFSIYLCLLISALSLNPVELDILEVVTSDDA